MDNQEIEIKVENDDNLESIVYKLLAYKARGKQAYCIFNGVRLDSNSVTMDLAFKNVTGKTKEELEEIKKAVLAKKEEPRVERTLKEKKDEWLRRGKYVIYPEKYYGWETIINGSNIESDELEIETALEIMEMMEKGKTIDEIVQMYENKNIPHNKRVYIENLVFEFGSQGPDFCEKIINPANITRHMQEIIDEKRYLNATYAMKNPFAIDKPNIDEAKEEMEESGFSKSELADIKRTCAKVIQGFISGGQGNEYLKRKYGLVWSIYPYNGRAFLKFANGKTLRFYDLINEDTEKTMVDETKEDSDISIIDDILEEESLEEDDIIIKR